MSDLEKTELEMWQERIGKTIHVRILSVVKYMSDVIEVEIENLDVEKGAQPVFKAEIMI